MLLGEKHIALHVVIMYNIYTIIRRYLYMNITMKEWLKALPESKKPMPLLSFPAAQLVNASVYSFTHDANLQAEGIVKLCETVDSAAAICMMDLSVEAEAFGCNIKSDENEVPVVTGILISDEDDAENISVPKTGAARTALYIDAARKAKEKIADIPVIAGIIGPFSLAGRLMDVSETLINCIAEPELVHTVLKKTTAFLKEYAKAYKAAGIDGIVMAEPLAGILSPQLECEFSAPYVKEIIESVQDDNFIVIYHNCGPNVPLMTESLASNGAAAYHFGDAVDIEDVLIKMPPDKPVCGNISPVAEFVNGTPESMRKAVFTLKEKCKKYPNFVLSSGCDIPWNAKWENIKAFFE